jgi:putative alpha-1,2-mannosidase
VHLGSGSTLTINAAGAQDSAPYIQSMTVNGTAWNKACLDCSTLSSGATLDYTLSSAEHFVGQQHQCRAALGPDR